MNVRLTAFNILQRVFYEHGYASLMMRDIAVNKTDMPFLTTLVYGTIRNRRHLEYQWQPYTKHVRQKTALLLDMAVYELQNMHTPDYAVIHEYVNMCSEKEKGFVNAVLRKVQNQGERISEDPCIRFSHPDWMFSMFQAHYGFETAMKIMEADQKPSSVYGRINPLLCTMDEIENDAKIHMIDTYSFLYEGNILESDWFAKGKVLIQNPSSILPVLYLEPEPGDHILDVCAAPGTKTQLIATLMQNHGSITACDLYENRLRLVDELMEKTGVSIVHTMVNDAASDCSFRDRFDRILCDVPCSGLGDLSHKPEIRWHVKPEDLDEIIRLQAVILRNAAGALKDGGTLVYSTCTLNKKENERQVEKFLKEHTEFVLAEERTVFPFEEHHDGFYCAKMVKTSA